MFNPHQTMAAKSDINEAVNSAQRIGAARGLPPQQPGMAAPQGQPMQPGMPVAMPTMTMQGVPQMPLQGQAPQPMQLQGQMPQQMGGPPGFQNLNPAIQQMIQARLQQHMGTNPARMPGAWLQQPGAQPNQMAGPAARYGVAGGPQQQAQTTGPMGALVAATSGPMGG